MDLDRCLFGSCLEVRGVCSIHKVNYIRKEGMAERLLGALGADSAYFRVSTQIHLILVHLPKTY